MIYHLQIPTYLLIVAVLQIIAFMALAIIDAILAAIQWFFAAFSNVASHFRHFDRSEVTECCLLHASNLYLL